MKPAGLKLFSCFTKPEKLLDFLEGYRPEHLDVRHLKNI